ncbi:MAG: hypothetical protein JSS81_20485 [Acidobacteria bacterium]|nr:hypothetical protein [Acidobacteriota bacterium]
MKLYLLLILTLLAAAAAPAQKKTFIGYKHKGVVVGETLPNGVKDLGGGLLSNENYGVSRFSKGGKFYLWLEKISGRDTKGVPDWIVKDVLEFDTLGRNQEFLFSYSSVCTIDGAANLDTIVLAEFRPKKKTYKVLKAWKANIKREKFEKLSTDGIRCRSEKSS